MPHQLHAFGTTTSRNTARAQGQSWESKVVPVAFRCRTLCNHPLVDLTHALFANSVMLNAKSFSTRWRNISSSRWTSQSICPRIGVNPGLVDNALWPKPAQDCGNACALLFVVFGGNGSASPC